ncbi:MAG: D-glycerate dehydrogenase [Betaproteobacteria bacterium]|nr:D-glycerate dehydrogenase [Betaproteobacteria bacterium]MDH3437852.1 D-glycerate dehydrogenase [Betaproteobacteria bacterium]
MKLFIPQPIPEAAAERLERRCELTIYPHTDRQMPYGEMLEAVRDQDILYALGEIPYDKKVIETATKLKFIAAMHSSAKFVDKDAATRRGIPVAILPSRIARTTAEFTFALLMATAWRIPEADRFLRGGQWQQNQSMAFLGTRMFDKTLGVVGMGTIGTGVTIRARACGMRIVYNKRTQLSPPEEASLGAEYRSLVDLFRESDFIVLTPALTKDTKGMISAELIAMMKPSAILINTSRGPVVDEAALEQALAEGRIRGAGLDVYENEIPEADFPGPSDRLKSLSNVVFTPHIGTAARETREEMAMRTAENIERFLDGKRPLDVLNPEVYGEAARHDERIG